MLRKAKPGDAAALAEAGWREDDVQELEDVAPGIGPEERVDYITDAISLSAPAFTWQEGAHVLAVGGVLPSQKDRSGLCWIVSTEEAHTRPWAFLRSALGGLNIADIVYDRLTVLSGSWLDNHHRWLRRLGFVPTGELGQKTTIFSRRCS
jgi:hypothetical protein